MLVPWLIAPEATLRIYFLVVFATSCISFLLYGWDKWQAIRGRGRVAERTLHTLAFVGGWPGAWLGQRVFCHKTRKRVFHVVFWCIVAAHLAFLFLAVQGVAWR